MHPVKCVICGQKFDRDKFPCIQIGRRYAHKECSLSEDEKLQKEQQDLVALENYIMKLLKIDYIDAKIRKQIKTYKEDGYSYSGIHKALTYFYEVKGNSTEKANGGIGIVPYVYQNAYNYYFALWQAQQKNKDKVLQDYVPKVKEVVIPRPQRKIKKRELFTFLDEESE